MRKLSIFSLLLMAGLASATQLFTPAEFHDAYLQVRHQAAEIRNKSTQEHTQWFAQAYSTKTSSADKEMLLQLWLEHLIQDNRSDQSKHPLFKQALQFQPHILIPHHDRPDKTLAAFSVADKARALQKHWQAHELARSLKNDSAGIWQLLLQHSDGFSVKSAAFALEQANTETREQVLQFALAASEKHSAAAIARLKLAELDSRYHSQLIAVVHHAPLDLARKALIQAMEDGVVQLDVVVKQAFQRPEIGGLAVAAYEAAGLKQAEMLWDALAQMHLGADAARVLAKTASDLEKRVASSIHTANPVARSRMLLALKLRNTEASQALLARILQSAEWLTAQQRVEVASWL